MQFTNGPSNAPKVQQFANAAISNARNGNAGAANIYANKAVAAATTNNRPITPVEARSMLNAVMKTKNAIANIAQKTNTMNGKLNNIKTTMNQPLKKNANTFRRTVNNS